MLGAVKGDDEEPGVSLFRLLSRRWKPLAPVKARRLISSGASEGGLSRAWIGKPRWRSVPEKPTAKTWNPWLWIK
jgi:hypothetical protein